MNILVDSKGNIIESVTDKSGRVISIKELLEKGMIQERKEIIIDDKAIEDLKQKVLKQAIRSAKVKPQVQSNVSHKQPILIDRCGCGASQTYTENNFAYHTKSNKRTAKHLFTDAFSNAERSQIIDELIKMKNKMKK